MFSHQAASHLLTNMVVLGSSALGCIDEVGRGSFLAVYLDRRRRVPRHALLARAAQYADRVNARRVGRRLRHLVNLPVDASVSNP